MIVATSRRAVNRWIANLSDARAIPVNVVDDREASRFIVPAIIDRDPVLVAVSTGGPRRSWRGVCASAWKRSFHKRFGELASWLRELRKDSRASAARSRTNGGAISRPSSTAPRHAASSKAIGAARARIAQQAAGDRPPPRRARRAK